MVTEVKFDPALKELHLHLGFARGSAFLCPVCGSSCKAYDSEARVWRHLNFFEHESYLHANLPRVKCSSCGVKVAEVPWARPGSGFTLLFEAMILTLCKHMPVFAVARIVGEHDTRLWRVLTHYVELARREVDMSGVREIGVDETSRQSGHEYVTLFADMMQRRVLFVTEGKDAQTIAAFSDDLRRHGGTAEQIEKVCMDMSVAFQSGVATELPNAEMIFDRFHVVKLANDAVDTIRRQEVKTNEALKETRYLWLSNPEKLPDTKKQKLATLQSMNSATATAYQMKLNLQELWTLPDRLTASAHLDAWYDWVSGSGIGAAMKRLANTVKSHASGILNYFPSRLTSGLMEGINSLVQAAKSKARGYRNSNNLKTIIYLLLGDLRFPLPT